MSETLNFALRFSAIGILMVFGALTLIAVVVTLIRKTDDRWQLREKLLMQKAIEKEPTIDNLTLVLISAAVATMIQGRFHIRKVRRLLPRDSAKSPWSVQGRAVLHGSHISRRGR